MPVVVNDVRAVLLDIEGTTTPMDFVHTTLFNYAKENVGHFLKENAHLKDVLKIVDDLSKMYHSDASVSAEGPGWDGSITDKKLESATRYCIWLIDRDSKASALKELEGQIWKEGYGRGDLRGSVYEDVPGAFKKWKDSGKKIYIYSSGSVLSQKLLFSTTEYGDMTRYIEGYFDTSVGKKADRRSYERISEASGIPAHNFLFLSDAPAEINAAVSAGFSSVLVSRGKGSSDASHSKNTISDFAEIILY
jgi:enolase-phosphatase E1